MIVARWVGLGQIESFEAEAAYRGLALAQSRDAAPIVLWAQAQSDIWLGQGTGPGEDWSRSISFKPSLTGLLPVEAGRHFVVLIVPKRLMPGREARWLPWALAPMLASYRQFGLPAYLDEEDVWLHGRRIAHSGASSIGECAVIASSFMRGLAVEPCMARASAEFRSWLRDGLSLAESELADIYPSGRVLEEVLRGRIEAQLGWQFEHSWMNAEEQAAIERRRGRTVLDGV